MMIDIIRPTTHKQGIYGLCLKKKKKIQLLKSATVI